VPTSIDRNSKPDTVFLCLPAGGGATSLVVDASQNRTNLTNNTTYVSEANSARTALSSPRELTIVVEIASGRSGVLVYHGNAGGYGYRVRINAGAVEVAENAILLLSVALPGLAVGAQEYAILWSQHDDGAQVRSELAVVNTATGAWAHAQGTHAGFAPSAADSFIIGAAWGGATAFSGGLGAFNAVRVGGRHHSGAEHAEDWLAERTTGGWSRITLAAADITALAPDNTNDRYAVDTIDLSWTPSSGAVTDIVIAYAAVGSPTNAQLEAGEAVVVVALDAAARLAGLLPVFAAGAPGAGAIAVVLRHDQRLPPRVEESGGVFLAGAPEDPQVRRAVVLEPGAAPLLL
jgi:hypothetical protein